MSGYLPAPAASTVYLDTTVIVGRGFTSSNPNPAGCRVPIAGRLTRVHVRAGSAGSADQTVTVSRSGVTLATVTLPAAATTATLTLGTPVSVAAGDVLTLGYTAAGTPAYDVAAQLVVLP